MKTTLLATPCDFLSAWTELVQWADEIRFSHAWVDSRSPGWSALEPHLAKVRKSVAGLHFGRTDPKAIRALIKQARAQIRVVERTKGTFHPKLVVGYKGRQRRAILGSGNLTVGAFSDNTEINATIVGSQEERFFRDIEMALTEHWEQGKRVKPAILEEIEEAWKQRDRRSAKVLSKDAPGTRDILSLEWAEYHHELARARSRDDRLDELRTVRQYLKPRFADMDEDERKFVAGFAGGAGWFGSLRGNGTFKHLVNAKPEKIGAFIDRIPLRGEISLETIREVFKVAYKLPAVRIGTVTRLLCVKRPDLYFPINAANERLMRNEFGWTPTDADSYITMLEMIHAAPWFNARRPRNPREREAWDARVALLDLIVYEYEPQRE